MLRRLKYIPIEPQAAIAALSLLKAYPDQVATVAIDAGDFNFQPLKFFDYGAFSVADMLFNNSFSINVRTFKEGSPVESLSIGIRDDQVYAFNQLQIRDGERARHGHFKPFTYGEVRHPGYDAGMNSLLGHFNSRDKEMITWISTHVFNAEASSLIARPNKER